MKFIYALTLLVSIPIAVIVTIICIPLIFIGDLAKYILTSLTDWLNMLNDNLEEINDGDE